MASSKSVKLTTDKLETWMGNLNEIINNSIAGNILQNISDNINTLSTIAGSDSTADIDENDLCYRLNDLSILVKVAKEKIQEFITAVDKAVKEKIDEIEAADKEAADKARLAKDKFKETADEIEQLTLE